MISVLVDGEFLDIMPTTSVTIRRRHNLFDGSPPSIKRGSYTLPFTVLLTDRNKKLLDHPDLIDNSNPLLVDKPAYLYLSDNHNYGLPYLGGKVLITNSTETVAEISLVTQRVAGISDVSIDDIPLGNKTESTPADMRTYAKATATAPTSHDICFFPIYAPQFWPAEIRSKDFFFTQAPKYTYQNPYDFATQTFGNGDRLQAVTPFLKLSFVVKKIFEHAGIHLYTDIQGADDIDLIYLYHNRSLYVDGDWPTEINYNDLTPDVKADDIWKQYAALLFLAVAVDPIRSVVEFVSWRSILRAPEKHNWTSLTRIGHSKDGRQNRPEYLGYEGHPPRTIDPADYTDIPGYRRSTTENLHSTPDDIYYEAVQSAGQGRSIVEKTNIHATIDAGGVADPILIEMVPLRMSMISNGRYDHPQDSTLFSNDGVYLTSPDPGSWIRYRYDDNDAPVDADGNTVSNGQAVSEYSDDHAREAIDNRLDRCHVMLYRGIVTVDRAPSAITRPYANNTDHNPADIDAPYPTSLLLDGDRGLVATRGAEAMHFLRTHKQVTRFVDIGVRELLSLNEFDKVRIGNMVYLVKEIEITFNTAGVAGPAKVVLCTVA